MSMLPADAHLILFTHSANIDAVRYNWLRQNMTYRILCDFPLNKTGMKPGLPIAAENWPAGLDAAIDNALKEESERKEK